jgi:nicotinate-nucleotide adenylyltransferase
VWLKLREIWGEEAEYFLVIGSDLIKQIRQWYHIDELLAEVSILVVPRPGYLIDEVRFRSISRIRGKVSSC